MPVTDLTVAAVVEKAGSFLIVEETVAGRRVLTQPGGHIDPGESAAQAAQREVLEEAGIGIRVRDLINSYLWHDDRGRQCLRIVFAAELAGQSGQAPLDDQIHAVHWLRYSQLAARQDELRSPSVLRCIDDFLAGERQPRSFLAGIASPDEQLDAVLARAELLTA